MALDRLTRALSRARYAATGAAIGAFTGGLINRKFASSGAAFGALVGAAFGEARVSAQGTLDVVKDRGSERVREIRTRAD